MTLLSTASPTTPPHRPPPHPQPKRASLATGTRTLLLAAGANRVIDVIYRVMLVRFVGAEIMGAYGRAMPFYYFLLIIASGGIPAAVVNLVAERSQRGDEAGEGRIVAWAVAATGVLSAAIAVVTWLGADWLALELIREPRLVPTLHALAPALFVMAVSSAYRGFFQGKQQMGTVAVAHLAEEALQVLITLPLVWLTSAADPAVRMLALAWGFTISETFGLGILIWLARRHRRNERQVPWRRNLLEAPGEAVSVRRVAGLAVPTTFNRLLGSVSMMVSALVIPAALIKGGHTHSEATTLYGELTAMAWPLITVPGLLTFALAYNLTPAVAAAWGDGDRGEVKRMVERSLWVTQAATLPLVALLAVWAAPITKLAFGVTSPAASVAVLALASPFLYWEQVLTGVLVGLGKPGVALVNFGVGELTSLALVYHLTPVYGPAGAAFGWAVGFTIEAVLDHLATERALGERISASGVFLGPVGAAAAAVVALLLLGVPSERVLHGDAWHVATRTVAVPGLFLAPIVYLFVLAALGGLKRERWQI